MGSNDEVQAPEAERHEDRWLPHHAQHLLRAPQYMWDLRQHAQSRPRLWTHRWWDAPWGIRSLHSGCIAMWQHRTQQVLLPWQWRGHALVLVGRRLQVAARFPDSFPSIFHWKWWKIHSAVKPFREEREIKFHFWQNICFFPPKNICFSHMFYIGKKYISESYVENICQKDIWKK